MSDTQINEEGKKTIVAFIVGLLIGGLLVWAFSGDANHDHADDEVVAETTTTTTTPEAEEEEVTDATAEPVATEAPALPVGDGAVVVANQPASARISLTEVTYPIAEGWIGVRDYTDENLGSILGVVRFSESQGLVPEQIILQRPTIAGRTYAVVFFTENGDRQFNSAADVQLPNVFATFVAE